MAVTEIVRRFIKEMEMYESHILPDLLAAHGVSPAKFKQVCISQLKKNPELQKGFADSPSTMYASILFIAEVGLSPDEAIGEAFLYSFYNKDTKKKEIKPIIGYHGIIKILLRSGSIKTIDTNCVFDGDVFEYELGLNPILKHIPNHDTPRNSNTFKYAYSVARTSGGETIFRVMSKNEIIAVRDMAKITNYMYFNDKKDPNFWMPQKTILKQLSKLLDKDYYGSKAIQYDSVIEGGGTLTLDADNRGGIKLIEGAPVHPKRFRTIYDTLGNDENQKK